MTGNHAKRQIKGECSFEALKTIYKLFIKAPEKDLLAQNKDRKVQFNDEAPRVYMYRKDPRVQDTVIAGPPQMIVASSTPPVSASTKSTTTTETGTLLEYLHLMKLPKCKDEWNICK